LQLPYWFHRWCHWPLKLNKVWNMISLFFSLTILNGPKIRTEKDRAEFINQGHFLQH
jgi:hypothetical protein